MKIDNIYTPSALAREIVAAANLNGGDLIADFAAGRGELLVAAHERWPLAQVIAIDIDRVETQYLKKQNGEWMVGRCNFLNPKSRNNSPILRKLVGKIGLILLNPPFSCRGGKTVIALASGISVKCSTGLAFVVNSIDYLASGGMLVAILPSGSLSSEKDDRAWKLLRKLATIETIMHNGHRTFPEASVNTAVIRLIKLQEKKELFEYTREELESDILYSCESTIKLVRGNIQMDEVKNNAGLEGVELIHSTELKEGNLLTGRRINIARARLIIGPAVLIPRVGRPTQEKVVCYTEERTFALSDCILAIECPSVYVAQHIRQSLIQNWNLLEQAYTGSGAKYITIKKYIGLLRYLGYLVNVRREIAKEPVLNYV